MSDFDPYTYFNLNNKEGKAPNKSLMGKQYSKRNQNYTWMRSMFGGEYNPDKLGYKIYNEMLNDPQIRAASRLIKTFLLSKKMVISPASEDPVDVERAEFIEYVYDNLLTPLRQVRRNDYTCLDYGYSVSEKIYDYDPNINKIVIRDMRPIHIETLKNCFVYDDYGNVITVIQNGLIGEGISIPADKCHISSYDETFGNKYGESLLKTVYDNYFLKSKILEWWAIYLHKLENPAMFGTVGENGDSEALQSFIDAVAEGLTGGVGRDGDKIQLLESSHRGEGFISAINYHDTVIFRAFMIGSLLLGQAENQGGSYGQSQTHLNVVNLFLDGTHEDIATVYQNDIKQLVDWNYGPQNNYPKVSFEPFTNKDLLGLLAAIQPYADKFQVDTGASWFTQLLKTILKQYADIEITEELEGVNPVTDVTSEEVTEPLPVEHQELLKNVTDIFPATTN